MANVIVFIWMPHVDNFGHAALGIEGGPYVSWWPSDEVPVGAKGGSAMMGSVATAMSMRTDKEAEGGRNPDWASGPIPNMDVKKIRLWWNDLSPMSSNDAATRHTPVRAAGHYDLRDRQCASVVMEALLVGGLTAARFPKAYSIMMNSKIMTPMIVKDIAAAMTGEMGIWDTVATSLDYGQLASTLWNYRKAVLEFVK